MKVFHSPRYFADLGAHIMPIRKFQLVRDTVEQELKAMIPQTPASMISEVAMIRVIGSGAFGWQLQACGICLGCQRK